MKQAQAQADIGEKRAATAKDVAQTAEAVEKTQTSKEQRTRDAFTMAYQEAQSDVSEYDTAVKEGKLPAEVSKKIGTDMQALAPKFESFGVFPPEVIERAERQKSLNETLGKAPGC